MWYKMVLTLTILIPSLLLVLGCSGDRDLEKENEELKTLNEELTRKYMKLLIEKDELENELRELRETPGYRYNLGLSYFNNGDYESAAREFQYIIEWFPDSRYAEKARMKLEEVESGVAFIEGEQRGGEGGINEVEKAISEWVELRNNEGKKGTIVTWPLQIFIVRTSKIGNLECHFPGEYEHTTYVGTWDGTVIEGSSKFINGDYIYVTGKFLDVFKDGLLIEASKVVNEGYRE
jgi:hypothetical protein